MNKPADDKDAKAREAMIAQSKAKFVSTWKKLKAEGCPESVINKIVRIDMEKDLKDVL